MGIRRSHLRATRGLIAKGSPRRPAGALGSLETLDPTPCPPGWRTGPPDYVGIGAQKAGTTWWFSLVEVHPDVHRVPGQRPELHFFDRFYARWPGAADVSAYHAAFPRPEGVLTGEKTPEYMACHWVPRMLYAAAPQVRLIALLRDPLDRFVSGATHTRDRTARRRGVPGGARAALDWRDEKRFVEEAFQLGLYAEQLARFLDWFPAERLLTLQYERCVADPATELARTFRFLGLQPHQLSDATLREVRNATASQKIELSADRRVMLVDLYGRQLERLRALVPDLDLALWPNFASITSGRATAAHVGS